MNAPSSNSEALAVLRRRLKIVLFVVIPVQLLTIVSIPAFPILFFFLLLPNVILIGWVIVLDRRIIASGGESFWRDGKFRGFDRESDS